jgi:hypothetical protein
MAAIVLLYFIEYPSLVRVVRQDTSVLSPCTVKEAFNCADCVEDIASNKTIGKWRRGALSSSENHHAVVMASCISILDSIQWLPRQKAKKYLKKTVLRVSDRSSQEQLIEGFHNLRSDLTKVVLREDVTRDAAINAILFQGHLLTKLFGNDKAIEIIQSAPNKGDFEIGLARHRQTFTEGQYQMF